MKRIIKTYNIIIPRKLVTIDEEIRAKGFAYGKDYFYDYDGAVYCGMNWWAAKEIGCPFPYPKDTAVVAKCVTNTHGGWHSDFGINDILLHEQQEAQLMQLGLCYPDAHSRTTALCGPNRTGRIIALETVEKLVKS